jgi:hypothetical protein
MKSADIGGIDEEQKWKKHAKRAQKGAKVSQWTFKNIPAEQDRKRHRKDTEKVTKTGGSPPELLGAIFE